MKNTFFYENSFKIYMLVLAIVLPKVFADDCEIWNNVMMSINEYFYKDFQSKNFANCCEYDGLTCDSNFITGIKLTDKDIGYIGVSNFNNEVVGHLQNLSHLTSLELQCSFGGSLPEKLGDLTNLEKLNLQNNHFKGNLPDSFCNLKKLKYLNLSGSYIDGYIPYGFKNLENLENLNLKSTKLKGYVPLIPNLKSCDYEFSDLCHLKSSKCNGFGEYEDLHGCSKENIKETNNNNGNPNPDSDEFKDEDPPKTKKYSRAFIIKIGCRIAIAVLAILGFIVSVYETIKRKKSNKKTDDTKKLINNNNAPSNQGNGYSNTPYTPSYLQPASSRNPPASTTPYTPSYLQSASSHIPSASPYTPPSSTEPYSSPYYRTDSNIPSVPPSAYFNSNTSNPPPPPYYPPNSTSPYSNYTYDKKSSKN